MRRGVMTVAICAMMAAAAQAQVPQSPQAAFDAAEAAMGKGEWAQAASAYSAALAGMRSTSKTIPIIRARLASALLYAGKRSEARMQAEQALAGFRAQSVTTNDDLSATYALLGEMDRRDLDMPAAVISYRQAIASAPASGQADEVRQARIGIALAAVTTEPAVAAEALDAVIADPGFAALPKPRQADILSIRARAELNRGDAKAAAKFVNRALDMVGRTSTRVNLSQVQIRGDAALIYAKLGDQDSVRQFLTYSGAGHLPDNGWLTHAKSDLPVCGGDVRPDDVAVIEFAIDEAGHTLGAAPVYASRPGAVGVTFARSVREWRWSPAEIKKLGLLWRSSVRIELRCVTRPPGIRLFEAFRTASGEWLAAHGATTVDLSDPALKPNPAPATPAERVVAALVAFPPLAKASQIQQADAQLKAALDAADASPDPRAYAANSAANNLMRTGQNQAARTRIATAIADLQARPGGARAAGWLRTEQALRAESDGDLTGARATLDEVIALPEAALPADDPIRAIALLHQSLIAKRTGQKSEAEAQLAAAGLNADSCSLLDVQPVVRNMTISTQTFPSEAVRWGFEGTVREAFDINADGSVAGVRTVIAYPPLVFGPATEKAVSGFRYRIPTIGDKPVGCTAQTVNVRYVLP